MPTVSSPHFRPYFLAGGVLAMLFLLALAGPLRAETTTRALAPGITLTQEIETGTAPLVVNILRVDLSAPGVHVRCGQAMDAVTLNGPSKGRESVRAIAARNNALAAVNADFFPFTGDPVGIGIRDGELFSEPLDYRVCVGFGPKGVVMDCLAPVGSLTLGDGSASALDGINRVPHNSDIVVLTPTYAATPSLDTRAVVVTLRSVDLPVKVSQDSHGTVDTVVPLEAHEPLPPCPTGGALLVAIGPSADPTASHCKPGDTITFRFDLMPNVPQLTRGALASRAGGAVRRSFQPAWTDIEQAVGGGPWLVRNGQINVDSDAEQFPRASFVDSRHARTAVGVAADGKLLLVTVDGKMPFSRGASLAEMAGILQRLGAVNAINLDGGGSTTMVVGGSVVNRPSDGSERAVADSLLVYGAPAADVPYADGLQIRPTAPDGVLAQIGASLPFTVTDADGKPVGADVPVVWGTSHGWGFISQAGVFRASQPGTGEVVAWVGNRRLSVPVRVLVGPPALLRAALGAVANNPPDRNRLSITVLDRYGNPVAGQKVEVVLHGGQALSPLVTDEHGQASVEIVWDAQPGKRSLTVSVGTAVPVTLRR